jgi:minimal PKS ketosynthase (KS/KS alpha)
VNRRVAITGIGVIAPGGVGTKAFWQLLTSGRSATRAISTFDATPFRSRIAAECDFDPAAEGLSPQEERRMDRAAQFAVVCAREALTDSGIETTTENPFRTGVALGSAVGCSISLEREYVVASDGGRHWLTDHTYSPPHAYDYFVPSSMAAEVAWSVGAQGPATMLSAGCTSGIDAIAYGAALIREGTVDVMAAGGTDAPITPITVACFDAIKATSPENGDAEHASRPFDARRKGFVLAEGAAVLILEEWERARKRGAHIYAEIAGFKGLANAYTMTGLRADGHELGDAVTGALESARMDPTRVDYVNAHGSGTKMNDRHETAAFKRSLGDHAYRIPVSSIKSMIGHSLGAIGAIELAACALSIEHSVVPPTANLEVADPECDLDYVPLEAREHKVDVALSTASGFGGFQSAMLLSKPGGKQ